MRPMLKAWLAQNRTRTKDEIAREIGISTVSLWRIAEGRQQPSPTVAVAIERVTGIPALSWANEALRLARSA